MLVLHFRRRFQLLTKNNISYGAIFFFFSIFRKMKFSKVDYKSEVEGLQQVSNLLTYTVPPPLVHLTKRHFGMLGFLNHEVNVCWFLKSV